MVKELVARGVKGQALLREVMRLTGLPQPDAQELIDIELTGKGDVGRLSGPPIWEYEIAWGAKR